MQTPSEGAHPPNKICLICKKQFAKYTCPKCNIQYCSLQCYKTHGSNCTEKFHQEHVEAFLKSQKVSIEDKRKMINILKKIHEQQQDEEDLESELDDDLMEKFLNLDLEGNLYAYCSDSSAPESFEELTKEQQEQFKRAIADGRVGKYIQIWEPWWTTSNKSSRVVFLSEDGKELPTDSTAIPSIPKNIPPLTTLTKAPPSPLLAFNLVDLLYSYCFTARLYNGDLYDEPLEVLETILQLSDVLSKKKNFGSATEVVQQMIENSLQPSLHNSVQFSVSVVHDVSLVVSTSSFVLAALSDLHKLFQTVIKQEKSQSKTKEEMQAVKNFELSEKKVWFFLVWAHEQPQEFWKNLEFVVEEEHNKHKEVLKTNQKDNNENHFANINKKEPAQTPQESTNNNNTTKKKPLIEELS